MTMFNSAGGLRRRGRLLALSSTLALSGYLIGSAPAASAADGGWVPYCGASQYVNEITVAQYANGDFSIDLEPSDAARFAIDPQAATVGEWHAIQDCVSGLYGSQADSIWDQLICHQYLALVPNDNLEGWRTGVSYGLDSWRGTFAQDYVTWVNTACGNTLGEDPAGEPISTGRPDLGVTDIQPPADIG